MSAKTLYKKIVDTHTVKVIDENAVLLYCDMHVANEYTSPQAFAGLRQRKLNVFSPNAHLCGVDHIIPTHDESPRRIYDEASLNQAKTLQKNCSDFGIRAFMTPMTQPKALSMSSSKSKAWLGPVWWSFAVTATQLRTAR